MFKKTLFLSAVLVFALSLVTLSFAATWVENGTYLPAAWIRDFEPSEGFWEEQMVELERLSFKYQFCNLTEFDEEGNMSIARYSARLSGNQWENILVQWCDLSHQVNPDALAIGWVNGNISLAENVDAHQNMADFCAFLVAEDGCRCDGVHIDFEPVRQDNPTYLQLMQTMRAAIGDDKHFSVALPLLTLSADYIHDISLVVDQIGIMCYATGINDSVEYIDLISSEVARFSAAMDPNCELCPIIPNYTMYGYMHNPQTENIINCSAAIDQAIGQGANVHGAGLWWWYEFYEEDKVDWLTYWVR